MNQFSFEPDCHLTFVNFAELTCSVCPSCNAIAFNLILHLRSLLHDAVKVGGFFVLLGPHMREIASYRHAFIANVIGGAPRRR
jgi:hypothetical protein